MPVHPGSYELGPSSGRLWLRTFRQGIAARAGHDLVLEARSWHARVAIPREASGQPSVEAEVDLREVHVLKGTGGVKPLSEGDKAEIHRLLQRQLRTDRHPIARFFSSTVQIGDSRATIEGSLTLTGATGPLDLEVEQAPDGTITATATIVQTRWGIKPYSGFFGALKLRDDVTLEAMVTLAGRDPSS